MVASRFGGSVLELLDNTTVGFTNARAQVLPEITTLATLEYEFAQVGGRLWSHMDLWDSSFNLLVALHIDDTGDLHYTDSFGTDHFLSHLAQDSLHSVALEVDLVNQMFDLSVNGVALGSNLGFLNSGDDLMYVEFRTSTPGAGAVFVFDDLLVVSHD